MQSIETERRTQGILEGINNPAIVAYLESVRLALPKFANKTEDGEWKMPLKNLPSRVAFSVPSLGSWNDLTLSMYWINKGKIVDPIRGNSRKNGARYYDTNRIFAFFTVHFKLREIEVTGKPWNFIKNIPKEVIAQKVRETKPDLGNSLLITYINELQDDPQENGQERWQTKGGGAKKIVSERETQEIHGLVEFNNEEDEEDREYLSSLTPEQIESKYSNVPYDIIDDFSPTRFGIPPHLDLAVIECFGLNDSLEKNNSFDNRLIEYHTSAQSKDAARVCAALMRKYNINLIELLRHLAMQKRVRDLEMKRSPDVK